MGDLDQYKRERDWFDEEMNQLGERERANLLAMEREDRAQLFYRLIGQKPLWGILSAMTEESRRRVIDDCFRAWKENQSDPFDKN